MTNSLLFPDEPPACTALGVPNNLPFLLVCDHAGRLIPRRLGTLGVSDGERQRHIAWDIGAAEVTRQIAARLGAFAVLQSYSRLVIDCNRDPRVPTSIATISEDTPIPGNETLSQAEREQRIAEIYRPYHDRIAAELDRRQAAGIPTLLVAIHSFTPVYRGVARPWHCGMLYNRDPRLADAMMALLRAEGGLVVGDNQPYAVSDESDYTIPVHAEKRGLPYGEIEIRQDLIADEAGQAEWAERIARLLTIAWDKISK
ncbi:MAG TPA: N-formylglutamate amidohydrolase [Alphaproteobacteria bacterium]|jgi:predicted N-formylglutamate amidohydrolase|nr:N-formylglutamate amidohydrolase [Alphaproteobacteria bacterium]